MTAKKRTPPRARNVIRDDSTTFTFSSVLKWVAGVASTVLAAMFVFLGGWVWNTAGDVTVLRIKLDSLERRVEPLELLPTQVTTQGNQLTSAENLRSLSSLTLADRMNTLAKRLDDWEREARWRRERADSGAGVSRRQ